MCFYYAVTYVPMRTTLWLSVSFSLGVFKMPIINFQFNVILYFVVKNKFVSIYTALLGEERTEDGKKNNDKIGLSYVCTIM